MELATQPPQYVGGQGAVGLPQAYDEPPWVRRPGAPNDGCDFFNGLPAVQEVSIVWKKTAVFVLAFSVVACGFADQVSGPRQVAYEGEFLPTTPDYPVSGTAVALGQGAITILGMDLSGLEAGMTVTWSMRLGLCGDAGEPVVDPDLFPPLQADAEGRIVTGEESEADDPGAPDDPGASEPIEAPQFAFRLEEDTRYTVEIFAGLSVDDERIACADMEETELKVDGE